MVTGSYFSKMPLNVMPQPKYKDWLNGLKKKRERELYMLSTRDPSQTKGQIKTESEGLKKIFHANGDQKKAGVAVLISDKTDFEINTLRREKEGQSIMIKGSIQEEDITIMFICTQHRSTTICKTNANKYARGN